MTGPVDTVVSVGSVGARPDGRRRIASRRMLHPGAWWIWATALAAAALRTTNPLLLGLILAVVAHVVMARRTDAPWSRSFGGFLRIGVFVILVRVVFQMLFGVRIDGTTLFSIPSVTLPSWAAGVSLGGPVTLEALIGAACQGLRLAVVIACFGAASSLCSPYRMLRALPSALYEAGVAITVALTFAPQAAIVSRQVREARRLRGRTDRGPAAWLGSAMPVLEGALERSVALAASMDARGYGRRGVTSRRLRRAISATLLLGLCAIAVGAYGLLDDTVPAMLRLPPLMLGAAALTAALVLSGRRLERTRYRADPWSTPEWIVASSGVVALITMIVAGRNGAALEFSVYPLAAPSFLALPTVGILLALLPAQFAPRPALAAPAEFEVAA
ncbi:MAG: energy-coupling factor transporter transmembrane protein EcfT [Acidobacteria bacterium]|nr:energy-coupling factor transporter transmembrane protein EcfT [Acidobacteriota bacterium]